MKKQNVVLIYSIWYPECGNKCTAARPQLGLNFFIEKEKSFKPLFAPRFIYKSAHNIMCRLNKSDEYLPIWNGAIMFGRDKEKLLKTWDEYHRVELETGVEKFNSDEEAFKKIIKKCNNERSPEVYYNILKAQIWE